MRRLMVLTVALGALTAALTPGTSAGADAATYAGSGTLVAKRSAQAPLVDDGAAVCFSKKASPDQPDGLGGACLAFPQPGQRAAIMVEDEWLGRNVAFQVCVDMNQDGHCYMGRPGNPTIPPHPQCEDVMAFSHADGNVFHNPLGYYRHPVTGALTPLPTEIPPECVPNPPLARKSFRGYVVFLCEGVHEDANGAHTHTPSIGSMSVTASTLPLGAGDFCQTIRDNFKEYYYLP